MWKILHVLDKLLEDNTDCLICDGQETQRFLVTLTLLLTIKMSSMRKSIDSKRRGDIVVQLANGL